MTEYEQVARERQVLGTPIGSVIDMRRQINAFAERERLVAEYSWAIPNDAAIETIAADGPVLEVGAGNGYWAWELQRRGVDVVAYDPDPYVEGQYIDLGQRGVLKVVQAETDDGSVQTAIPPERVYRREWAKVEEGDHTVVTMAAHRHRSLLICWPTYGGSWATEAVEKTFAETVFLVGELGGCTGDEGLVPALSRDFKMTATVQIPQYEFLHDFLSVWRR